MTEAISSAVERWQQSFAQDAVLALDAALSGRVSLGQYNRARPSEALVQMLKEDKRKTSIDTLDEDWAVELPPTLVEGGSISGSIEDLQGRFNRR